MNISLIQPANQWAAIMIHTVMDRVCHPASPFALIVPNLTKDEMCDTFLRNMLLDVIPAGNC
jgi:hypothetical protein